MWFQTLKTRQTIKNFITANSHGQTAVIEYSDKKVDVHMLKREASPLSLDDNTSVAFANVEDGSMYVVSVCMCGKGKPVLEFKVWDITNTLGFTAKEISVQDMQRLKMNDTKLKAIVNVPDLNTGAQNPMKINSLMDYVALSVSPTLVAMWKCRKMDNSGLSLELVTAIRTTMAVQDIGLMFSNEDIQGVPSIVIGEPSGVQIFTPVTSAGTDPLSSLTDGKESSFSSTLFKLPSGNQNNSIQDIQQSSVNSCILSDNNGCLWYLTTSKLIQFHLPSSNNGNGVYAVQPKCQGTPEGWLATVQKNQTINLYKLDDVIKMSDAGLIPQPWHVIFSTCQLNSISFIDVNTLAAGSPSNRTLSLWTGLDCIGQRKGS